ncbi:hypothetical protein JTB14_013289 [Gonioctena quinquepunctata]|nr:hypothetical protein JTB14_013289 [Gonioctena quinquepunctata]
MMRILSEQIDLLKQNNNNSNKHQAARPETSYGEKYQRADKSIRTGFTHFARSPAIDAENPGVSGRGNAPSIKVDGALIPNRSSHDSRINEKRYLSCSTSSEHPGEMH